MRRIWICSHDVHIGFRLVCIGETREGFGNSLPFLLGCGFIAVFRGKGQAKNDVRVLLRHLLPDDIHLRSGLNGVGSQRAGVADLRLLAGEL